MAKNREIPEPPTFDDERRVKSVLYHALKNIAGKKTERGVLAAGKQHDVELDIRGVADGYRMHFTHEGKLQVGFDGQTSSSSKANPAHVLALVLERRPTSKKGALDFLKGLPDEFRENGSQLPAADEKLVALCEKLLEALTVKISTPRAGAVSFTENKPA